MNYQYKIFLSFDLGEAIDPVRELEKVYNSVLSKCGINEEMKLRSKALTMTLKCNRKLFKEERDMVKKHLTKSLDGKFPSWNFKVDSIRIRKTRNKSQSR